MADIRLKNLARDLIKPLKSKGIKTRNIDYLKLVMMPKDKCRLFTTFPASGTNWTDDITAYVLAKTFKGDTGITFDENEDTLKKATKLSYPFLSPADARSVGTQSIAQSFPELNLDYMFHTHGHWKESGLWSLDDAKTGMITRHIPTAIYSYASKRRNIYDSFEECLEKTGVLDRAVKFYNSWNVYKEKYPKNFFYFRYEEARKNPVGIFSNYLEFMFNQRFDDKIIQEALEYFSFEKQKEREKKFTKDDKKHFHFKGKTSYQDEIGPEIYQLILKRLSNELEYNFGYDYVTELKEI